MSRIILIDLGKGSNLGPDGFKSEWDFSHSVTIDHSTHVRSRPRVREYLDERRRLVVDITMPPASNGVLIAAGEAALERARAGRKTRQRRISDQLRTREATLARQKKRQDRDVLVRQTILEYRKSHPGATDHKVATAVGRKLDMSPSTVKRRLSRSR